jgi:hypothetical protein
MKGAVIPIALLLVTASTAHAQEAPWHCKSLTPVNAIVTRDGAPVAPELRLHTYIGGCSRVGTAGLDMIVVGAGSDDATGVAGAEVAAAHGVPRPVSSPSPAPDPASRVDISNLWDGEHFAPAEVPVRLNGTDLTVTLVINADGSFSVS